MERTELIKLAKEIEYPKRQYKELYHLLDELGITYKKTTCGKCRQDLYNIALEELGLIGNAAEVSDFNSDECTEYKYIRERAVNWHYNGKRILICPRTPLKYIKEFIKTHKGYFVCKSK